METVPKKVWTLYGSRKRKYSFRHVMNKVWEVMLGVETSHPPLRLRPFGAVSLCLEETSFFQKQVGLTLFSGIALCCPWLRFISPSTFQSCFSIFKKLACPHLQFLCATIYNFSFFSPHFSFPAVIIPPIFFIAISFYLVYNLFWKCATCDSLIWDVISVMILRATIQEILFLLLFDHLPQIILHNVD